MRSHSEYARSIPASHASSSRGLSVGGGGGGSTIDTITDGDGGGTVGARSISSSTSSTSAPNWRALPSRTRRAQVPSSSGHADDVRQLIRNGSWTYGRTSRRVARSKPSTRSCT